MVIMSKFSESLSELMDEHGLTVQKLSEDTGINFPNIYSYLRAERLPSVEKALVLADYFNCSVGYLLGMEQEKHPQNYQECPPFPQQLQFLIQYFSVSAYKIYTNTSISKARFFEWKSGKRKPSMDNIIKLAEFFDCSVDFVLGRVK